MKKSLLTTAFIMSLASASAFAHHPAADIVDPEIYAMIDENVADTPHADLTFDEMGRDADDVGAAMNEREETVTNAAQMRDEITTRDEVAMDADTAMDTIDLLQNIDGSFAE